MSKLKPRSGIGGWLLFLILAMVVLGPLWAVGLTGKEVMLAEQTYSALRSGSRN